MPIIPSFKLERYFAQYEFKAKYLLSPSDCESLTQSEVLAMADPETYALWEGLSLGYTESPGHPLLRHEIASQYKNVRSDNTVVAAPEELVYIAINTLLSPGDHLVCIAPAYQSLYEIAKANGCSVTEWAVEPDGNRWRLPVESLEAAITPQTRLLIVNFPHNPTGYLPTAAEFEAIINIARRHNLYVFCDEMYRLLEHNPDHRLPAMADAYERGISLSGLSKSFALPGLRIGWLATQDSALPAKWLAFKDYTTICNSAPSEILAIIALRATVSIVQRNLTIVQDNIEVAKAFIASHADSFEWFEPDGGSIAFPKWTRPDSLDDFCRRIVEERGVMIVPGSIFDYPGPHFRVGLGRRNLSEVLEQVAEFFSTQR
jgi:aspartate/methionine/tyrosine aminotransferase